MLLPIVKLAVRLVRVLPIIRNLNPKRWCQTYVFAKLMNCSIRVRDCSLVFDYVHCSIIHSLDKLSLIFVFLAILDYFVKIVGPFTEPAVKVYALGAAIPMRTAKSGFVLWCAVTPPAHSHNRELVGRQVLNKSGVIVSGDDYVDVPITNRLALML